MDQYQQQLQKPVHVSLVCLTGTGLQQPIVVQKLLAQRLLLVYPLKQPPLLVGAEFISFVV
jgi:hypothetical protein